MFSRILFTVAVVTLGSFAVAQQNSGQQAPADALDTSTCSFTFSSGSGPNTTQYCVTVNGNVTQFSRGSEEYIQVGAPVEGYGICDMTANPHVAYFDYGLNDSGNLAPSTVDFLPPKVISTRLTSDGTWQIKNTITKVAANASGPGSAKVSMQIKNLTGINRDIAVIRQADVDFLRSGISDFNNDFDSTRNTVIGLEPSLSGLSLTNNTFSFGHAAFVQDISGGPSPCDPFAHKAAQPFAGDGSVVQWYVLTVPSLGTKTMNMTYKPI
jgi:hypothetical protein